MSIEFYTFYEAENYLLSVKNSELQEIKIHYESYETEIEDFCRFCKKFVVEKFKYELQMTGEAEDEEKIYKTNIEMSVKNPLADVLFESDDTDKKEPTIEEVEKLLQKRKHCEVSCDVYTNFGIHFKFKSLAQIKKMHAQLKIKYPSIILKQHKYCKRTYIFEIRDENE